MEKYDYSLVNIKNSKSKIKIICKKHGVFSQTPYSHINSHGCIKCTYENRSKIIRKKSDSEIINEFREVHGDLYDYSLMDFKNKTSKIKIVCEKHGVFEKSPFKHLNLKKGCPKCSLIKKSKITRKTDSQIIKEFREKYGNLYDYSLVNSKGTNSKVKIICKKHGIFYQTPYNHIKSRGCPKCFTSYKKSTEEAIRDFKKFTETNMIIH